MLEMPKTVDEVLVEPGLSLDVARSMLAAVTMGKTHEVSDRLWMRLLVTYIDQEEALADLPAMLKRAGWERRGAVGTHATWIEP